MKEKKQSFEISGNIIDVTGRRIFRGTVKVADGKIADIREEETDKDGYILPGLIDAHIHIESSLLVPSEFARLAMVHGTVATVSDPHEIANVLGTDGVRFMINNGKLVPFRFFFGAPSCVPATAFETSGASIGVDEIEDLLQSDDVLYLSEMMNFPGVLNGDPEVMQKLALAQKYGKPVDGHAPGLRGPAAERYIRAGISTDHECFTKQEAVEKIGYGMKILIREGSAAKNFDALSDLIDEYPDSVMLCSDDRHPDDLMEGHIDGIVRRAIAKGCDIMNVLRSCTLNPVKHYSLPAGLLRKGDPADLIIVDDLENFRVRSTFINGVKVAENGKSLIKEQPVKPVNVFHASRVKTDSIRVKAAGRMLRIIGATDGQLITKEILAEPLVKDGNAISDTDRDILKIVVKDRYHDAPPAVAFIHGLGLKEAAIASSVAHDSHNIICAGTDDELISEAINSLIRAKGGIALVTPRVTRVLPLPFGGIMSADNGYEVAQEFTSISESARKAGSPLQAPFMTLSFMALLVIPELKLSDRGLFDGNNFRFTENFADIP